MSTPPAGNMNPPPRPLEAKATDVSDLSDVLLGSGVDLKEEEAALVNRQTQVNGGYTGSPYISDGLAYKPLAAQNYPAPSFSPFQTQPTLSPNVPGDRSSFYGAGTFNQPPVSQQSVEDHWEEQQRRETRRAAEMRQYHMNDSFLMGGNLWNKLNKQSKSAQIQLNSRGLLSASSSGPSKMLVVGPDGNEILTVVKGEMIVELQSEITEILTLISLAARERVRTTVEDTAALAKGRRIGSRGVVPVELQDVATGQGKPISTTTVASSPAGKSLKSKL
jgi:hypothetical protein